MKIALLQPAYSTQYANSDAYFEAELALLRSCDESTDLIVCPEYCDIPCLASTKEEAEHSAEKYGPILAEEAYNTARRCHAMVFINMSEYTQYGRRNTTFVYDREGNIAGRYCKEHLTAGEMDKMEMDSGYTLTHSEPTVLELEGIRFAFMTCYDFYFYEEFANIARKNVDCIIGCSHQRTDTHRATELICGFLAYNTNAYVLRSCVSMDENSDIGGGSMAVAPDGKILLDMKSRVGIGYAEIDFRKKYKKPAGFGNPESAHYEYIEKGRRPWKYRPAGSAICLPDGCMPYPRICAHRGFNTVAPENSMPAYGAAVACGATEIEFDLWETKDGEIVSIHDRKLSRVSDGEGYVYEKTYDELCKLDFGVKFGEKFKGLRILTFEEILQKFSCHCIMNIHIKSKNNTDPLPESYLRAIIRLIDKYDCRKYVYFMTGNDTVLAQLGELAPDICRCCGGGDAPWEIVDRAIRLGCRKVQLFKPYFDQAMIDKAHGNNIICNVFYADTREEARQYLDMGIDTVLTNDYLNVSLIL